MEAALPVVVFGVGIASSLQEKSGELQVRVINGPPDGVGSVWHGVVIDFFAGDDKT